MSMWSDPIWTDPSLPPGDVVERTFNAHGATLVSQGQRALPPEAYQMTVTMWVPEDPPAGFRLPLPPSPAPATTSTTTRPPHRPTLVVCATCFATVYFDETARHLEWHRLTPGTVP